MKLFRKLGRKRDSRGDGQPGPAATPQPPPSYRNSMATPVPQQPPPAGSTARNTTTTPATRQRLPPSSSARNTMSTSIPPHQLPRVLSSPASSLTPEEIKNLIRLGPEEGCPVCYNLDPYHAPQDRERSETLPSWARAEYDVAPNMPAAKVTIEKSEDLLASAQRGCLYCFMVRTAFGAVHPGWENERSFIYLYMAPGLPVVARLLFGGTSAVAMGPEEVRSMGIVLPEGQTMQFVITIGDPDKPAVEVELYRPVIGPAEPTVSDAALATLVEHMGAAPPVPDHAGSPECFDFIRQNMASCARDHQCSGDGPLPLLPDRVIWIEANIATRIQVVEPRDIRAKYIALSYCWGPTDSSTYLTSASTMAARKAGIEYRDLPPLFQDVVTCARELGIEYIWIDRLCIIHGDDADFKQQTSKMDEIYGNATLNIAAASAASENDRILVERDLKWRCYSLDMKVDNVGSLPLRFRRRTHELGMESKGGDYGKLSTRARIWQERLLSSRTVFFTPSALKFECRRTAVWEGFGPDVRGHSWSGKLDDISHASWAAQVEEYTGKDIARQSDRLPVMEAVMRRVAQRKGWSPLWGMWANALVEGLCWQSKTANNGRKPLSRMNPAYYAPSWSWASVDGPISYTCAKGMGGLEAHDPLVYDLEVRSVNADSGLIRVCGRVVRVKIACRVEPDHLEEDNPVPERRLGYAYEIPGMYDTSSAYPVNADVPLKPWSGTVAGQQTTSVIRVPHGEAPPQTSWSSTCFCLLVGKMTLRTEVLFLGISPREPTSCERIGVVSGLPPSLFEGARKMILDII